MDARAAEHHAIDLAARARAAARALRDAPTDPHRWTDLALLAQALGAHDRAVTCWERAIELEEGSVQARVGLGSLLAALGRHGEAVPHLARAVAIDPQHADAANNLGVCLLAVGRLTEAEAVLRRAVDDHPGHVDMRVNLALVLAARGELAEPVALYHHALRARPRHASTWVRLGQHLLALGLLDEADLAFVRANRHAPGHVEARVGLASVLERRGRTAEARALLEPLAGEASVNVAVRLAMLRARNGAVAEGLELLDRLDTLAPLEESLVQYTRADLLDRLGRYDDAFDAAFKGNTLRGSRFDHARFERMIQALTPPPSVHAAAPRSTIHDPRPIFIVGSPRSGTSLVEQILSAHPAIDGCGELEDLPGLLQGLSWFATESDLDARAQRYLAKRPSQSFTDKMPVNVLHLEPIDRLFPGARVILCRRDLLDTGLSCFFQNFNAEHTWSTSLGSIARWLAGTERVLARVLPMLRIPLYVVHYEELVTEPDRISRELVDFCGVPWHDACARPEDNPRVCHTASTEQVRKRIHGGSVRKSRHYAAHLGPLVEGLAQNLPLGPDVIPARSGVLRS